MSANPVITNTTDLSTFVGKRLLERNQVSKRFFPQEATRLAMLCRTMSERFLWGGRLLAFGKDQYSTDAQHVSVEFVHPVIVGKRALPALDLSMISPSRFGTLVRPDDIVMGFAPPEGDMEMEALLSEAHRGGALTFALSGASGDYSIKPPSPHPFIHQEMIEILYHTLWETVHVFFEHREMGHEVGEAGFLYPFLGGSKQDTGRILEGVAMSIVEKALDDQRLREKVARESSETIAAISRMLYERFAAGGKLITFGNGGSATDANDFALDCVMPPMGFHSFPAISLSMEPASISAIANDIGSEAIFLRQLVAHAGPEDVAFAISTSGSSANIIAALRQARKMGLTTVALLGYDGGEIVRHELVDYAVVVRSDYIPRIQEVQASIYHVIRETLEVIAHGDD